MEELKYTRARLRLILDRVRSRIRDKRGYDDILDKLGEEPELLRRVRSDLGLESEFKVDPRAVLFNGLKSFPEDQRNILDIYYKKRGRPNEFPQDIFGNEVACLEYAARKYLEQKCAFQEQVTRHGYDCTAEVVKDADVGIAALSRYGTLMIFGRIGKGNKRPYLLMKRIHTPGFDITGEWVSFKEDLKLGSLIYYVGSGHSSNLIGLATNANAPNDFALQNRAAQTLCAGIDESVLNVRRFSSQELMRSYREFANHQ